jgi:membrane associated rhomboid family serine protease
MIPLRDNEIRQKLPVVTYMIIFLNGLIYLWGRHWHPFGNEIGFADLTMRPNEVVGIFHGIPDKFPLVTIFSAMFLHANLSHILGNMVFLLVFGAGVEDALGGPRFALYYLFWGVISGLTQVFVTPESGVPTLGASGAIGGVMGAYFLLFPSNKVEILIPIFFLYVTVVSAWVLLGVWFIWQVLFPQQGVANWAHAGGFLAGMVTVLMMGGRGQILKNRLRRFDSDFG